MKRVSTFFLALVMAAVLCLAGPATALAAQGSTTRVFYTEKNYHEDEFYVAFYGEEEHHTFVSWGLEELMDYSARYTVQCNPNGTMDSVAVEANLPEQSEPMVIQVNLPQAEINEWGRNEEEDWEYFEFYNPEYHNILPFEYQNIPGIPNGTEFDWENSTLDVEFHLCYIANQPYDEGDSEVVLSIYSNLKLKDSEDYYEFNISLGTTTYVKDITDGYYEDVPHLAEGEYTGTGSATVQTPFGQFTARPGSAAASIEEEYYGYLNLAFRMKTIAYEGYLDLKSWNRQTGEATYEGNGNWQWNGVSFSAPWVAQTTPDGKLTLHIKGEEGGNLGPVDEMDLELTLSPK